MLGVINYGSGNFRSVCNALDYLKIKFIEITSQEDLHEATHLILPGVGAFKDCISRLKSLGIYESINEILNENQKYFLGICVGHQILSTAGTEFEKISGFDIIKGDTIKINFKESYPVPHIGWSEVFHNNSKLFEGIENGSTFYFVHSYYINCKNSKNISSYAEYGTRITSSVESGKIFGVQFHPEKSQLNGLKLLKNFCNLRN